MKMTYAQWELLLSIYQENQRERFPDKSRCNKRTLDACVRNGWIEVSETNQSVRVTEKGEDEAAIQISQLYIK